MDKNLHQNAKAPMIALINPTSQRGWANTCKPSIYKQNKALKGRPDVKHGCNPCAQTQDVHGCNPCAQTPTQHRGKPRLLLLLLALVAIATTARAQITVFHDNVKYVLIYDGTAYVDYSPGAIGTLNLRETVSYNSLTCTVTRIADGAFFNNYQITGNLVIPNTVTHIGSDAFRGCSGLNGTLTLPDSLQTIGSEAFYQCTGLTGQLNLPATLTSIGGAAFSGCSGFDWSTLTLPPLLTEIGYDTFYGIQFTGDLVVPDGVTSIGDDAFNLNKFSSITIGNGVTTIGHRAFRLTAADQLTLGSSVASIGDEAFRYYDEDITHDHIINIKCLNAVPATLGQKVFLNHSERLVEVPCGARDAYISSSGWGVTFGPNENISEPRIKVELMGVYYLLNPCDGTATVTHSGYTELDENNNSYDGSLYSTIVIPSTVEHEGEIYRVTRIGAHAFLGASEVRTVEIGNYVESIGNYAFYRVNNLIQVICHNPVPPACGADVFYAPDAITQHLYYLEVPCGSVEAYRNASQWSSFKNFGTLDFKAKVEINGIHYVLYCDGTANVTHAGYSDANSNNDSYSGVVTIPEMVEYNGTNHIVNRIRNNAFKGCTALTSVSIGGNVENIGNNAFEGCIALSSITSERLEPPALGSDVFSGVPTSAVLNVLCNAVEAYLAAAQWQDFNIQGVVAASINAQIDGVYYVLNPCTGVATVTHAGYDWSYNANYMNSYSGVVAVTIPETVTYEGATYDVTRIADYAFWYSTSLTSIVIGEKVWYVGREAFRGCTGLQSITNKNPTPPTLGWGDYMFYQVPTSAVLYVPCDAIETYMATNEWNRFETITAMLYQAEDLYYKLCGGTATVVAHPSYATLMGANIDVTVHVNGTDYPVVGIEAGAFDGCTELLAFDCHFTLTELGDYTFRGCTSLLSVGLYNTDTPPALGEGVFEGLGLDTLMLMVPFCSQYEYSQHETWGQFGEILGNGSCEYNFTNAADDKQWSNPANWQDADFETCTEAPGAGARVAIFEDCEIGEDVTVGSVTIGSYIDEEWGYYERLTLKDGATLTATNFIYTTGDERNFIIEDGAQVVHTNAGAEATVKKAITAYSTQSGVNNGWHLIALPLTGSIDVDSVGNLIGGEYDLYAYDETSACWKNSKNTENSFAALEATKGYLYAHGEDVTLEFSGTLQNSSDTISVPLSYTEESPLSGFNLVGNPFPCEAYLDRAYYVLSANGTDINPDAVSNTVPIPPCTAVFVKAVEEGDSVVFTRAAP